MDNRKESEVFRMSIGMILLLVCALLILFGVLQRVLDRMALTDRQALLCVAAIFIGGWLPDIDLGMVTINIGGALIPIIVCVYLFLHAGSAKERMRAAVASAVNAASVYAIGLLFPADPARMPFDPLILYGIAGGIVSWLLGRSRRSAFIAGILGVILADILVGITVWFRGIAQAIHIGSAGALDAIVLSGLTAVLLCELVGETMERIQRKKARANQPENALEGGDRA